VITILQKDFVIGDTKSTGKVPFNSEDLIECERRELQTESMAVLIDLIVVMKNLKRHGVLFEVSDPLNDFPDPSSLGTARQDDGVYFG